MSVGPIRASGLILSIKLGDSVVLPQNTHTLLGSWERFCWDSQEARPISLPMMTPGSGLESFIAFNQSCLTWQGEGGGSSEGPVKTANKDDLFQFSQWLNSDIPPAPRHHKSFQSQPVRGKHRPSSSLRLSLRPQDTSSSRRCRKRWCTKAWCGEPSSWLKRCHELVRASEQHSCWMLAWVLGRQSFRRWEQAAVSL